MKDKIINACKRLKILWDTYRIVKTLIIALGLIGFGGVGYLATDTDEPEVKPEPVVSDKVDGLKIIHINPEYALKGHAHPIVPQPVPIVPEIDFEPMINRAVEAYARKHDPQGLGH